MKLIVMLTTALAALSMMEAGLLRRSRARSSLPLGRSGGLCLNGGSSIPSLHGDQHMFCLCADGFSGKHCEIDISATCYEGTGLYYRGTASRSESGRKCVQWDFDTRQRHMASDVNSGRHRYCRNLEYRRRPWCYVMKGQELVQEYCDIPRCGVDTSFSLSTHDDPLPHQPAEPTTASTCGQRPWKQLKIVGGTVATVESHPWIAAIFWRSRRSKERQFRCGGSLVSPCWVLTAAHCFPDGSLTKARQLSVVLGKSSLNETDEAREQRFKVKQVIIHPDFDNSDGNFNNDIALLQLKAVEGQCAQETSSVRTVCVPPEGQVLNPGASCEIAGYGREKQGLWYNSQYLREAKVSLLARDVCRGKEYYGNMITGNMFCAGRRDWSQDACKGDSGGPLVCEVDSQMFLFGIISWGDGCAREYRPGVYTTVTNYNRWMEEKMQVHLLHPSVTSGSEVLFE